jgi:type I restriction enzyme S subunit
MSRSKIISTTKEGITDTAIHECNMRPVQTGTVLFSFKLSIGKLGIAAATLFTNEAIASLPILDRTLLCEDYLFHALKQVSGRLVGDRAAMGITLNKASLAQIGIPLPPLEEQRRIAAILDKAALVSTHIVRAADLRLALKRSLFSDLFRPSAQPAVTIGSDLPPSDGGWHWRLLTDIARLATGHTPDRSNQAYWGGDVPWITLGDIRELDGTWATSTKEMTTPEGIANSSAVLLPKGTVCFSRTASVGFSAIMGREMSTSQDFVNWVCGPELLPEYLMNALIFSRARLRGLSTGSTHKTIYFSTVEQFRVLLPPVELQTRFCQLIRKVDSMPLGNLSDIASDLRSSLASKLLSPAPQ